MDSPYMLAITAVLENRTNHQFCVVVSAETDGDICDSDELKSLFDFCVVVI